MIFRSIIFFRAAARTCHHSSMERREAANLIGRLCQHWLPLSRQSFVVRDGSGQGCARARSLACTSEA
jgi:hypothetical protein